MPTFSYHYHQESPKRRTNFPFAFHAITVHDEQGEQVGYLTVEHVTKEFVQKMEENPFLYVGAFMGDSSMFETFRQLRMDECPPKLSMPKALKYMEEKGLVNDGEHEGLSAEELEQFLPEWFEKLKKSPEFLKRWDSSVEYNFEKPMVHYIKINEEHRGKGLGLELYKQAALAMRNILGVQLHSSTNQSQSARICWDKMAERGWVEEVPLKVSKPYGKEMRYKINADKIEPQVEVELKKELKKGMVHGNR